MRSQNSSTSIVHATVAFFGFFAHKNGVVPLREGLDSDVHQDGAAYLNYLMVLALTLWQ